MDVFVRQLKELTNASNHHGAATSYHCRHVAVKLLRRFEHGTCGTLEMRYLLEDLLRSLPDPVTTSTFSNEDPYKDLRSFANLITSSGGVDVPLKAKPKRPASIDASGLVNDTKRSKVDAVSETASLQKELANIQLLYDLFNDLSQYSPPSGSGLSLSQLLSQALSTESAVPSSATNYLVTNDTSSSSAQKLNTLHLRSSIERLLPPMPRGQALRDKIDVLFSNEALNGSTRSDASTRSVVDFLEGLADILARLCAPIRDEEVKRINSTISTCREYLSLGADRTKLETAVKTAENQIQKLVHDMQHDLHLFNLGITVATTNEKELRKTVRREAMDREKKLVNKLYGNPMRNTRSWMQSIVSSTGAPLGDRIHREDLATCLVEALFRPQPMTIQARLNSIEPAIANGDTATQDNFVPPVFLLAAKHLCRTQNRLQAFTILATLKTLVPPSVDQVTNGSREYNSMPLWSERVWTLLQSEMLDDNVNTASAGGNDDHIKLANLADEIVKVIPNGRNGSGTDSVKDVEEEKIRSSVDRMLRLEDRVFALLHGRLKIALLQAVKQQSRDAQTELEVKGFTSSPLTTEMGVTVKQLLGILDWACECWELQ